MRVLKGRYTTSKGSYDMYYIEDTKKEEVLISVSDIVKIGYKRERDLDILLEEREYYYGGINGKGIYDIIKQGKVHFNSQRERGEFRACKEGSLLHKEFSVGGAQYSIDKLSKDIYSYHAEYKDKDKEYEIELTYVKSGVLTEADIVVLNKDLKYIELSKRVENLVDEPEPVIRSLDEISLTKDTTWLRGRDYYVVTDDKDSEELLSRLEVYSGPIAYDTETTGLRINMFSKINGKYANKLKAENRGDIRVDHLVGVIFCVEPGVSYYLPCGNKKFRNLYTDGEIRERLIKNIKVRYTVGEYRDEDTDIARYWRERVASEVTPDCILMERCRKILTKGYIVTHNGSFDWKVAYCYDIDTNLCEDTMLMHQLMFKYKRGNTQRGESSSLKHLAKVELGIDQLSLEDFFVGYKEKEDKGKAKVSERGIDFSYMDYASSKAYAPADGDMTLSLFKIYKEEMQRNYKDLEFIYKVEVLVSCAIGYMEFYGHRIDEHKIASVRESKELELLSLESDIRSLAGIQSTEEREEHKKLEELRIKSNETMGAYNRVYDKLASIKHSMRFNNGLELELREVEAEYERVKAEVEEVRKETQVVVERLQELKDSSLNLGAAGQVADLFYNKLGIVPPEGKCSVSKSTLEPLSQEVEERDGKVVPKYPIVRKYREWKDTQSLLTKFFGSLPEFMYPGGFIFSHYGQIQAATGRMSCSKPNAQQYCKAVTEIVIPRDNFIYFDADYSQIEYRTLVALANEPELKKSFADPDSDYHTSMASLMFDIPYEQVDKARRSAAKSFNFGIPYGMGIKSLAKKLHGNATTESIADAKEKYALYFKNQPNVKRFFDTVKEAAQVNGRTDTWWHRKRYYTFTNADGTENQKKKASALRQAGNAVIQGTAADIFKISVVRNWNWIRSNKLYGKVIIVNMIHDEQLIEIDCDHINVLRAFSDIVQNMQFNVPEFPPLYVGGGIGPNWKYAKGDKAEVHPVLAQQLIEESKKYSIYDRARDKQVWFNWFDKRVKDFRRQKVIDYITDSNHFGSAIHPKILSLLTSDFSYGVKKGVDESDSEYIIKLFNQFCVKNGVDASYYNFIAPTELEEEEEDDKSYYDGEEENEEVEFDGEGEYIELPDADRYYGIKPEDLVQEFGVYVSEAKKFCGVRIDLIKDSNLGPLVNYLEGHLVEDVTGMEFGILDSQGKFHKKFKVRVTGKELAKVLGIQSDLYD